MYQNCLNFLKKIIEIIGKFEKTFRKFENNWIIFYNIFRKIEKILFIFKFLVKM